MAKGSTKLAKAESSAVSARKRATAMAKRMNTGKGRIADCLTVKGGAFAAGAVRAMAPGGVAGLPAEAVLGIATFAGGVASNSPRAVLASAGMLAPTIADWSESLFTPS